MKLYEIQARLKAPKTQYNNFGKYSYRSCEDILESVKPLLENSTLTITDEIILIGTRYYIRATATFTDGTNTVSVSAYAREAETKKGMDEAQITGSASSYARKYALNGLFLIDDTKDSDSTNDHAEKKPAAKQKTITDYLERMAEANTVEKLTEIAREAKDAGFGTGVVADFMKYKSILERESQNAGN